MQGFLILEMRTMTVNHPKEAARSQPSKLLLHGNVDSRLMIGRTTSTSELRA